MHRLVVRAKRPADYGESTLNAPDTDSRASSAPDRSVCPQLS